MSDLLDSNCKLIFKILKKLSKIIYKKINCKNGYFIFSISKQTIMSNWPKKYGLKYFNADKIFLNLFNQSMQDSVCKTLRKTQEILTIAKWDSM